MAKKIFWKIWLKLNPLSKKANNDYIAEVSTTGKTHHNEDFARQIVAGRSEMRYETILSILNERDTIVRDLIISGSSTQDGNINIKPCVLGTWTGSSPLFNPQKHKITVHATPTAELRKALEDVGVEILGVKTDGGAIIGLVIDMITGRTDGVISTGGIIIIKGEKIKISPCGENGIGVFFVDNGGVEIPLDYPLISNDPKKILCRIPILVTDGVYTLKIVTRFSNNSTQLTTPRTLLYELPLTVKTIDTQL